MTIREKLKVNVLYLATLAFLALIGIGFLLVFGMQPVTTLVDGVSTHRWPIEILILLAGAVGGSGVLFAALAGQVATDSPPNHHKDSLEAETVRRRDEMEHEHAMASLGLVEVSYEEYDFEEDEDEDEDGGDDDPPGESDRS